jgi:hypothetical protein
MGFQIARFSFSVPRHENRTKDLGSENIGGHGLFLGPFQGKIKL